MDATQLTAEELGVGLAKLAADGIQADANQVRRDMVAQFADSREWVREYAVNALDAGATRCQIWGRETGDSLTIIVADDGCGMDRARLQNYMKIFKSTPSPARRGPVGTHGIGKLSVAAIPGQRSFVMNTVAASGEQWRLVAGCMLDDAPVRLERLENAGEKSHGTRFEITFDKQIPLREELSRLTDVLEAYVRFLPMEIIVWTSAEDEGGAPRAHVVHESWHETAGEVFPRHFRFDLDGADYDVAIGLGSDQRSDLYQKRVFVTSQYNLLCQDRLDRPVNVPRLRLRVDSSAFELPFGRHALRNEEVLRPLSRHLRETVLPRYASELAAHFESGALADSGVTSPMAEEFFCGLLLYDASPQRRWTRIPVFATLNRGHLSLASLRAAAEKHGQLYLLQGEEPAGIDLSSFEIPILSSRQPGGGVAVLRREFRDEITDLNAKEAVLEAPPGCAPPLGPQEKLLERHLRFAPAAVRMSRAGGPGASRGRGPSRPGRTMDSEDLERLAGVCEEASAAMRDLSKLRWRVGHLVGLDGTTPCRSHRFLLKGNTVILNLYHPETQDLVKLTAIAPALAGHWGLALCLAEGAGRILPHLTPAAREDLILADALSKASRGKADSTTDAEATDGHPAGPSQELDFFRHLNDPNFGLN